MCVVCDLSTVHGGRMLSKKTGQKSLAIEVELPPPAMGDGGWSNKTKSLEYTKRNDRKHGRFVNGCGTDGRCGIGEHPAEFNNITLPIQPTEVG